MFGQIKSSHCFAILLIAFSLLAHNLALALPRSTSTPITITRYADASSATRQNPISQFASTDDYFRAREEFFKAESARYLGNNLQLSDNDLKFNKILMRLKQTELSDGFADPFRYKASRHFFEVVDNITKSELFRVIEQMPKGAVLHAHDTAMASIDYVVDGILNNEKYFDILWYCDANVTADDSDGVDTMPDISKIQFLFARHKPKQLDGYSDWRLLNDERKRHGPKMFNEFLHKQFMLNTAQPSVDFKDINDVWNKFINIFITLNGVVLYRPVWIDYFYNTLLEFHRDNVQYIEFRGLLPQLYDLDGNQYTQMDTLKAYNDTLQQFKSEHPDFIGAKFIYGPSRNVDNTTFNEYMTSIKEFKATFPDFIAGFDLVGQEDLGRPLKEYVGTIMELHHTNPEIDFFFHAGETNWNGLDTDENLIDAILLGTKRIGHGYALTKHPKALEALKLYDIAVEVSPISNQVLKLVDDNRNHPCAHFFADNYPVVISSDDPSFWGAKPLSHDFYVAFMGLASATADLRLLKQLAINSLQYSSLNEADLYRAQVMWQAKWDAYIEAMLKQYGGDVGEL